MQAFATSFDGVDDRVIACLKQNTYLFVADGASDEQLCGRPKNQLHKVCKEQNIWNSKTIHNHSNRKGLLLCHPGLFTRGVCRNGAWPRGLWPNNSRTCAKDNARCCSSVCWIYCESPGAFTGAYWEKPFSQRRFTRAHGRWSDRWRPQFQNFVELVDMFALCSFSTSVINRIFHSPVISAVDFWTIQQLVS